MPQLWLCRWTELLFSLWFEFKIKLWGRRGQPDAKLTLIDFPRSERVSSRWTTRMPVGEFTHDAGERFFDVHVLAVVVAPHPETPAGSSRRRQKGDTDRARAELLYEAAYPHAGSELWTTEEAFQKARTKFPDNPLLAEKGPRTFDTAWRLARSYLEKPPRPERIDWDTR